MIFELEKPNLNKISSVSLDGQTYLLNKDIFTFKEYLYWDKLKYQFKLGENTKLKKEELWLVLKNLREQKSSVTPILAKENKYFKICQILPHLDEFLHKIDMNMGGTFFGLNQKVDEKQKYKFFNRGIMEEAIASAQLEGANTTYKVAKEFLRTGRKPLNYSEHMILNTFNSMKAIESNFKNRELDLNMIFELHEMITKNTLKKDEINKFRKDEDEIVVQNAITGVIYHVPPKVDFVKDQISAFIKFANDIIDITNEGFIHPIIKAIMLHFWIGYLHPFVDGNGRLARIIFYWYLLKHNYWAFAYLPISTVIRRSPSQYSMAYVYSEQDDYDLTYFIDYNIKKIQLCIKDFEEYLDKKFQENSQSNMQLQFEFNLNERQINLLKYLNSDKNNFIRKYIWL